MIVVTAKMNVKPASKYDFMVETEALIKHTRYEKGCISYNLYTDTDDPNQLVMLEFWKDMDDLDAHMNTVHFKAFGNAISKYLTCEIEISKFDAQKV
ncbi:Antibiotic biosynthesis monooxygenase [Methanobacterium lacus]|uniref:Antibiotic biosynthesis monooxygenase n=1 Tax=Methanobacterium lacus (strain AL-21) TaxID=877455 RepID=F0T6C9_METLA|nr:putative quinol monooxygenase [Methanobacterium lacus]ADZ09444.1 Antibiotic biosynthesis monooxygenase [Methanobacterium lacus]